MAILEAIGVLASPIVGMVGGIFTRKHERKQFELETRRMEIEHEHEQRLMSHEIDKIEIEGRLDREDDERDILLSEIEGADDIFLAGIKAESDLSKIKWGQSKLGDIANFFRAMIRPSLTIYLAAVVSAYASYELITHGLNDENRFIVLSLVAMFEICVSFWFSVRVGGSKSTYNQGAYSRE